MNLGQERDFIEAICDKEFEDLESKNDMDNVEIEMDTVEEVDKILLHEQLKNDNQHTTK